MAIHCGIIRSGSIVPRKLDIDISPTQITFVKLQSFKCTLVIVEIDISIRKRRLFIAINRYRFIINFPN